MESEVSDDGIAVKVPTAAKARETFTLRFPNTRPARFIASVVLGVSLVFCAVRIVPEYQERLWRNQQENLRKAGLFIFASDYEIRSDTRFQQIHLLKDTSPGGSVFVFGKVASETDRSDLRRLITAMNSPVEVHYNVEVGLELTPSP